MILDLPERFLRPELVPCDDERTYPDTPSSIRRYTDELSDWLDGYGTEVTVSDVMRVLDLEPARWFQEASQAI